MNTMEEWSPYLVAGGWPCASSSLPETFNILPHHAGSFTYPAGGPLPGAVGFKPTAASGNGEVPGSCGHASPALPRAASTSDSDRHPLRPRNSKASSQTDAPPTLRRSARAVPQQASAPRAEGSAPSRRALALRALGLVPEAAEAQASGGARKGATAGSLAPQRAASPPRKETPAQRRMRKLKEKNRRAQSRFRCEVARGWCRKTAVATSPSLLVYCSCLPSAVPASGGSARTLLARDAPLFAMPACGAPHSGFSPHEAQANAVLQCTSAAHGLLRPAASSSAL